MPFTSFTGPSMSPGLALECARGGPDPLEEAFRRARQAGYSWVEPYVFVPVELTVNSHLRFAGFSSYHHLHTADTDREAVKEALRRHGLAFSAFSAHTSLLLPQLAVPQLTAVIDLAAELGAPVVMSDEGPVDPHWMPLERAFDLLCFTVEPIIRHAQARGVHFALELHNALTTRPEFLVRLLRRFSAQELGVNFDTGNSFLAGNDPAAFLREVVDRVIHVHIKDIPIAHLPLRGKVTGTRVGVAAGAGVVDLPAVLAVLAQQGYRGVLSVECDTWEQAEESQRYLAGLLAELSASTPIPSCVAG